MLEYWNDGIMGFGGMGYWDVDKAPLDSEVNKERSIFPLISTFHYSTIPLFHVRGKNIGPRKTY
jgi:hypothetical protein